MGRQRHQRRHPQRHADDLERGVIAQAQRAVGAESASSGDGEGGRHRQRPG